MTENSQSVTVALAAKIGGTEPSWVVGESEYLFTAYSIFTVRSVHWGVGGAAHRIELDAASDNRVEAEATHRDDGRWGTPVGSETLPLAPWY